MSNLLDILNVNLNNKVYRERAMDGLNWTEQASDAGPMLASASSSSTQASPSLDGLLAFAGTAMARVETKLGAALSVAEEQGCPPRLFQALNYTIFPGGARIRPKLSLAVAWACGDDDPQASAAAAAAIEMLHCASLVHDDLPCFDDADRRRGKPAVHLAFGEPLAVLTGDALIVMAFETLAREANRKSRRLGLLVGIVGAATGASGGICAGQAWECEPVIDTALYHRAKTGSLFSAATMAGAAAAGARPAEWRALGELIGEAYQVADDIRDVAGNPDTLGKPVGRDEALMRPSACRELGLRGAIGKLDHLVASAVASIPDCPRAAELRLLIRREASQFVPEDIIRLAA